MKMKHKIVYDLAHLLPERFRGNSLKCSPVFTMPNIILLSDTLILGISNKKTFLTFQFIYSKCYKTFP